jgi:hypothetical protein
MTNPKGERALAIRDHVLPLIRDRGSLQRLNHVSIVTWGARALRFALRTPSSSWPTEGPAPSYQQAPARQQASALPYALEVWFAGRKVMSLDWSDSGAFRLTRFTAGEWEAKALALPTLGRG